MLAGLRNACQQPQTLHASLRWPLRCHISRLPPCPTPPHPEPRLRAVFVAVLAELPFSPPAAPSVAHVSGHRPHYNLHYHLHRCSVTAAVQRKGRPQHHFRSLRHRSGRLSCCHPSLHQGARHVLSQPHLRRCCTPRCHPWAPRSEKAAARILASAA